MKITVDDDKEKAIKALKAIYSTIGDIITSTEASKYVPKIEIGTHQVSGDELHGQRYYIGELMLEIKINIPEHIFEF